MSLEIDHWPDLPRTRPDHHFPSAQLTLRGPGQGCDPVVANPRDKKAHHRYMCRADQGGSVSWGGVAAGLLLLLGGERAENGQTGLTGN